MINDFAIEILKQYREKPTLINEISTVEEATWLDEALDKAIQALEEKAEIINKIPKDYLYDTETKDFLVYRHKYTGDEIHIERPVSLYRLEQEPKYCDRNICLKNEYNGIGCDECEVTKSQEPQESEE